MVRPQLTDAVRCRYACRCPCPSGGCRTGAWQVWPQCRWVESPCAAGCPPQWCGLQRCRGGQGQGRIRRQGEKEVPVQSKVLAGMEGRAKQALQIHQSRKKEAGRMCLGVDRISLSFSPADQHSKHAVTCMHASGRTCGGARDAKVDQTPPSVCVHCAGRWRRARTSRRRLCCRL
jgi:hypothetical protein